MATFSVALYKRLTPGGLKGTYTVPDSLKTVIEQAGEAFVLSTFIDHLVWHRVLTAIRNELSEAVEEFAKNSGATFDWLAEDRTVNGKTVSVIVEENESYVSRAIANGVVSIQWAQTRLQELLDDNDNRFELFAKEPTRKPRAPKKLPRDIEETVAQYGAEGVLPQVAAVLSTKLGRNVLADPASVGLAIKEHRDKLAAAAAVAAKEELALLLSSQ